MNHDADGPTGLASLVRGHRQAVGWTQRQLASRAGLSVGMVRDVEQGRTGRPRPASVRRLADCLGLDPARRGELLAALPPAPGPGGGPADRGPAGGRIRVAVLGPLIAWRGGAELRLGPDRQRAVLGLLALKPGVTLHREAIIDALWGDRVPASAAAMVQCYVSRLRRILHGGPPRNGVLCGTGTGYRLEAGHGLDVPRFRHAADQARAAWVDGGPAAACARYEHGLAWWRGDPLADIGMLREHPAVQLLRQQRAAMIVDYADAACAAEDPGRALPALGELAADDPLDERVHARLMIALACTGQQAAALGVYRRLSTRLDRDLGVRPGPELAKAHDRVLCQDLPGPRRQGPPTDSVTRGRGQPPGLAPRQHPPATEVTPGTGPASRQAAVAFPVPRQLPAPVPRLAGRAAELGALDRLLGQAADAVPAPGPGRPGLDLGRRGLAVITGPPGVGKTALAVHWAHTVASRFPDGQLYVRLHGSTPAAPPDALALPGLLGALGLPPHLVPIGAEARAALYRSVLAGRRMLLVLDDAAGSGQAAPLLPGCPGCLVLVTSRWPLTGLVAAGAAQMLTLTTLDALAAREMLADRLGPGRLAAEPQAAAALADACARLPATLAAVAAHAAAYPGLPLSELAAELRAAAPRLTRLRPARPALPQDRPRPRLVSARLSR